MSSDPIRVVFTPSGRQGAVDAGTSILDAARALGADLDSVCGGRGLCGRCQVTVAAGEFSKHAIESGAGSVSPWNQVEAAYAERRGMVDGHRLGCQALLVSDAVVDVPPESQIHRPVVHKGAEVRDIELDPVVHLHHVAVEPAVLERPGADLARLLHALEEEWGLSGLDVDPSVLPGLQQALRAGNWAVTAAVHDGTTVTAVWPGFRGEVYGVAVDVGSTTLAGHLCDLTTGEVLASAGRMNPQIRFGEDLMSRVSYAMLHADGTAAMTGAVRDALRALLGELTGAAGIAPADILEVTLVGNPIMHHLLLGIDPTELGQAPFALAVDTALHLPAAELELGIHPGARAYVLPCIAGHVGADAAAVLLAEQPHRADEMTLIVDVGTNAEIVLGNRHRILAASSPTGPAFEGAQISSGQRAAPGAIERVRIDPESLEPRFRVVGTDAWSNDAAFGDTRVTGICGSGIIEVVAEMFRTGVITPDGVIDGGLAVGTDRLRAEGRTFSYVLHDGEPEVAVTQNDVRAIQLAKAALHAGCRLLMDRLGIDAVDRIRLAGAFGSQIDPEHALILGLVPDAEPSAVSAAGNAAGTGARIALLNRAARAEIEGLVRSVEKVETAVEPAFQGHFVAAMGIPHGSDPYPRLRASVVLSEHHGEGGRRDRSQGSAAKRRRRRERR
jgi:uncharacterized 2Fe-2S/4Fe-4S cluster protein (DUF4445 family)